MKARVTAPPVATLISLGRRLCPSCVLFCYSEYPTEGWQITFSVEKCECPKCRHFPSPGKNGR